MNAPGQHTPGQWIAKPDEVLCGSEEICRAPLVVCLDGLGCEAGPRWQANARLIAAAPDMINLLTAASRLDELTGENLSVYARTFAALARSAVAKATGRA